MKPKEFDELVRQKFDQNDFEYNPRNWDKLAEELDGRAKKRSAIMWWWMPLAGVAASVALAVGIPGLLRHEGASSMVAKTEIVRQHVPAAQQPAQTQPVAALVSTVAHEEARHKKSVNKKHKKVIIAHDGNKAEEYVAIRFHEPARVKKAETLKPFNLLSAGNIPLKEKENKKLVAVVEPLNTFKPEDAAAPKSPKFSIILSGGINRGNMNNGYMAGATIRRMINDKVFVEGDLAFANSNNTQSQQYLASETGGSASKYNYGSGAAKTSSPDAQKVTSAAAPVEVIKQANVTYNISYAQVTPSIGYKIMKKMSIAAGPDFQEMLVDNRPAPSTVDRGNIQVAPVFDVGFVGKSEYSVTKNVKAAVSYRKGINSVLTLSDRFIDRDYLQFQVKCAIFNK